MLDGPFGLEGIGPGLDKLGELGYTRIVLWANSTQGLTVTISACRRASALEAEDTCLAFQLALERTRTPLCSTVVRRIVTVYVHAVFTRRSEQSFRTPDQMLVYSTRGDGSMLCMRM